MTLESHKRSRSAHQGVVTRIWNKLSDYNEEDAITYDTNQLDRYLSTVKGTESAYRDLQIKINQAGDKLNVEEEEAAVQVFEENLDRTYELLHKLISLQSSHQAMSDFQYDLEDLQSTKLEQPTKDHSHALALLSTSFQKLRMTINQSHLPTDHQLRHDLKRLKSQLSAVSSTERKDPTPPILLADRPSPKPKTVQLPKITLPTFNGELMEWWSQFKAAVDSNSDLSPLNKLAYLREAVKDQTTRSLLYSGAESDGLYSEVVALLHDRFDRCREVHANYVKAALNSGPIKNTKTEINQMVDTVTRSLSGLKHTGQYEVNAVFTSALLPMIPKTLQTEWEIHTKGQTKVPPVDEFLKFLRFRANILSDAPHSKAPDTKQEQPQRKQDSQPRRHKAAVHTTTPAPPSTYGPRIPFRYNCQLCPGIKHPLFQCPAFNNMSIKLRGDHLHNNKLCYNCLAPGHQTADCRGTYSCRICGGRHHTLVHREQSAPPPQAQPLVTQPLVNVLAATNPSIPSQSSPALTSSLMMTSQVLVKGPCGKQMVARALLDSGASMSLVSNRVAQTLQLPRAATQVSFSGAQATPLQVAQSVASMTLCSITNSDPAVTVTAAVMSKVTCALPLQGATHVKEMAHIKPLDLADPTFHLPGKVDCFWDVMSSQRSCYQGMYQALRMPTWL